MLISRIYGHPYKKGLMVAKNWIARAIKQLFGYKSDEKAVEGIWENGIAAQLGYKRKPDPSLLLKAKKYAEGAHWKRSTMNLLGRNVVAGYCVLLERTAPTSQHSSRRKTQMRA